MIEITNEAITKILEKQGKESFDAIRLGITGGGCAGMEYVFKYNEPIDNDPSDTVLDFGKFTIRIDSQSLPFLQHATLDYVVRGINESFEILKAITSERLSKSLTNLFI